MSERVVVTGLGTINALGANVEQTWSNAVNGISGVGPITIFDASDFGVRIACEVKNFNPAEHMSPKTARRRDRYQQFAYVAALEALNQAGLETPFKDPHRVGVIVSTAVGGLESLQEAVIAIHDGSKRVSPFLIPRFMPNGAAGTLAIDFKATGPCFSIASACASGGDGIGQAGLLLRAGIVDVVIAGASEATITQTGIGAFDLLGALSRRNEDYSGTPAPFDADRDGFVMSEGSAILILERLEHAEKRGAEVLAELVGYGSTADAYNVVAPEENGLGGAAAIEAALTSGGLVPEDVDYINAHGTGTELNDLAETRAIKKALGDHAYKVMISSTKSMTGHMMGATGALEGVFCIQAIRSGIVPPTIHLNNPDPECDLDYVPNQAREAEVRCAISNAFGFGGHNAVLAFSAFPR